MATGSLPEAVCARLREGAAEELTGLVELHAAAMEPIHVRLVLENPFVTTAIIGRLAAERHLAAVYEVRRDVVLHRAAPRVLALDWAGGLYWSDLMRAGRDTRLHPSVRRGAELRLLERLPGLALGERIALARSASAGVLAQLRHDSNPRVIAALLENPLLTEGLLAPLLASESSAPLALAAVAGCARWASRYGVRLALIRNPRTPVSIALPLLPLLKKVDLQAIGGDLRLDGTLRRRARLLASRGAVDHRSGSG